MHYDARSKFMTAAYLGDYDTYGLFIDCPLVSANGDLPISLTIAAQRNAASKRSAIAFGVDPDTGAGGYLIVQDSANDGTPDLAIWNRTTEEFAVQISPTGGIALNGSETYLPVPLPAQLSASATLADVITVVSALQTQFSAANLVTLATS